MRGDRLLVAASGLCLATALCCIGALGQTNASKQPKIKVVKDKSAPAPAATVEPSSEPDKVLYERSMTDLSHKRYEEERLSLETLINTYPDSEYLDKAKLAVADSYYNEGGDSNLTQAIGEYKSFVVFFPDDDKASYAQMQIGMAHYKMMAKSDRDDSEAVNAEAELQTFIKSYPDSKLVPSAEQKLRDVQEVIADGEFKVARFYYLRPDYVAAAARLTELTERYPLYSQSDEALWMLSSIYAKARALTKNEDVKNHYADLEGKVLDQLVVNYPLSVRAAQAKAELKTMNMAVPAADPSAVLRMRKQDAFIKTHHKNSILNAPMALMKTGADVSLAAQSGMPNLTPPDNSITARDILSPTNGGPKFSLSATDSSPAVDTSGTPIPPTTTDAPADGGASTEPSGIVGAPTTSAAPDSGSSSNKPEGVVGAPVTSASPATTDASSSSPDGAPTNGSSDAPGSSSQGGTASQGASQQQTPAAGSESSSKKKKSKLNPF